MSVWGFLWGLLLLLNIAHGTPLHQDAQLTVAAQTRAQEEAQGQICDHVRPDGPDWWTARTDIGWRGEIIAQAYLSPEDVMAAWGQSPAHWAVIVNPAYTFVGLGYCEGRVVVEFGGD